MAAPGDIKIVSAAQAYVPAILDFYQPIYAAVYPNAKYGMKPEHFSKDVFDSADTLEEINKHLTNGSSQQAFIAKQGDVVVGTISIERKLDGYELHKFYVAPALQGNGIGRRLFQKALEFYAGDRPLRVEVAESNQDTIKLYKHLGFTHAPQYGVNLHHWPDWPDGLHNGYIFMQAEARDLQTKPS